MEPPFISNSCHFSFQSKRMAEIVSVLRHELASDGLTAATLDACIASVDKLWIELVQSVDTLEKISTASKLYPKVCILLSHVAFERGDICIASKWALAGINVSDISEYNDDLDINWPNLCFNLFENTPYSRAIIGYTIGEYTKACQKRALALVSKANGCNGDNTEIKEECDSCTIHNKGEDNDFIKQEFVFNSAFARSYRNNSIHVCLALAIETRREDLIRHILDSSLSGKYSEPKYQILSLLTHILSSLHLVWDGNFRNILLNIILDYYKRASTELTSDDNSSQNNKNDERMDEASQEVTYLSISGEVAILMARNKEFKSLSILLFEMMEISNHEEFKKLLQLCLDISTNITPSERHLVREGIKEMTGDPDIMPDENINGNENDERLKVKMLLKCFSTNFIFELGSHMVSASNFVDTELYLSIRDLISKKFTTRTTLGTELYSAITLSYSMMASGTKIDQFAINSGEYVRNATHWNRFANALRLGSIFRYSTPTDAYITLESYLPNIGYKGRTIRENMSDSINKLLENTLWNYNNIVFDEVNNESICPYAAGGALMSLGLMFPGSAALSLSALRDYKVPNFSNPAVGANNLLESMSVAEYLLRCLDIGINMNSQPIIFGACMGLAVGLIGHMTPESVIDEMNKNIDSDSSITLSEKIFGEYKEIFDKLRTVLNNELPDAGFGAGILMGVILYNVNNALNMFYDKDSGKDFDRANDDFLLEIYQEIVQTCENTEHAKIQQGISFGLAISFMCFDATNTNRPRLDLVKLTEAINRDDMIINDNSNNSDDSSPIFDSFTSMISELLNHRLSWMRTCAVNCIGCAYAGTMNVKVVKMLLKMTAKDTTKEVSRAGVLSIGMVMCEDNSLHFNEGSEDDVAERNSINDVNSDEFVRIMQFLSTSHNSSIRAASALSMGIFGKNYNNSRKYSEEKFGISKFSLNSKNTDSLSSKSTYKKSLGTLMNLVFDSDDEVRQHALIGVSVYLQEARCSFFPQNVFCDCLEDEENRRNNEEIDEKEKKNEEIKKFVKSPEQKRDEDAGMLVSPHTPIDILTGKIRRLMFDISTKNNTNLVPHWSARKEEKEMEEKEKEKAENDKNNENKEDKKNNSDNKTTGEGLRNGLKQKYHKYKTGENLLSRGAALFGMGLINSLGGNGVFQLKASFGQINPVRAICCFIFEQFNSFHLLYELASVCCSPTGLITVDETLTPVPVEFNCNDPNGLFKYYAEYRAPPLIPKVRKVIRPLKSIEKQNDEDIDSESTGESMEDNNKRGNHKPTVLTSLYIRKSSEQAITSVMAESASVVPESTKDIEDLEPRELVLLTPFRVVNSCDGLATIKMSDEHKLSDKKHPLIGIVVVSSP